jgi:hypothetical protein
MVVTIPAPIDLILIQMLSILECVLPLGAARVVPAREVLVWVIGN